MDGVLTSLRDGSWITRERMLLWAVSAMIAAAAGLLYIVVTASGMIDYQGRPIGTDFSNVYAAGTFVLEGRSTRPRNTPVSSRSSDPRHRSTAGTIRRSSWPSPPCWRSCLTLALSPFGRERRWRFISGRFGRLLLLLSPRPVYGERVASEASRVRGRFDKAEIPPHPTCCARRPLPARREEVKQAISPSSSRSPSPRCSSISATAITASSPRP